MTTLRHVFNITPVKTFTSTKKRAELVNYIWKVCTLWLKDISARWGVPDEIVGDNGPQFSSNQFRKFSQEYNFKHTTTSLYYPKANGEADQSGVRIAKKILRQHDPFLALMSYRATPHTATGASPCQLMMGEKFAPFYLHWNRTWSRFFQTTKQTPTRMRKSKLPTINTLIRGTEWNHFLTNSHCPRAWALGQCFYTHTLRETLW